MKENKINNTPTNLIFIFLSAFVLVLITFGAYLLHFIINGEQISDLNDHRNIWAQFGSYAGGSLSPILAFLALIALLYSIHIQTRELNHSIEQLSKSAEALDNQNKLIYKQNIEATFFQMLKLYNEIVQSFLYNVSMDSKNPVYKEGRDALASMYGMLMNIYFDLNKVKTNPSIDIENHKKSQYAAFYYLYEHSIGHYYRILYNIFKFIGNSNLNFEEQILYADILRAHISKYELGLLFYNVFYFDGKGKGKMYKWIILYNVLKHLDRSILSDTDHVKLDQLLQSSKGVRFLSNNFHKDNNF